MKKITIFLFSLSIVLNLLLGAAILQNYRIPTAEAHKDIKTPGTYGPPALEIIDDDVTVSSVDVTLQNMLITGNLYLAMGSNEGTITLNQVEVQGEVIITGESKVTLQLMGCTLGKISVQKSGGPATIIAEGSTSVDTVDVGAEATLLENGLNDNAQGFKNVYILTSKRVILFGDFNNVDIATEANVKVVKGSAALINIKNTAANTELDLAKDVTVETLSLDAVLTLIGEGNLQRVDLNAPGLVKLQGTLGEVTLHVEGLFLELRAGSIDKLLVPQLESASSITMAADTIIENMELNSRTGITGQGQIGTVTINHSGVTIDQTPAKILIAEGLTAMINGEEYKVVPEPEPVPEPVTPTVTLNPINNVSMKDFGEKRTVTLSATSGATLSVTSSNSVASVSLSGNTLTVTGNRQGSATITVRATMSGYNSRTRTFTVTVNPIKGIERKSINEFTHYVSVELHNNDPKKYKVELQGFGELTYDKEGDVIRFWAIVPINVLNNSIVVTKR